MPITFHCPSCGKELSAPDSAAGLSGACRFCGATITAPSAQGEPAGLAGPDASPFHAPDASPPHGTTQDSGPSFQSPDAPNPPPYNPPPPYTPSSGYGTVGYGSPYSGPVRTSNLAIGSLISGIVGLCCCIGSVVGLILGMMAKKEIRESQGTVEGDGLATAGIVISLISLILGLAGLVFYPTMMRTIQTGGPGF